MSTVLTTFNKHQIVVSADSDDENNDTSHSFEPGSSPTIPIARSSSPFGSLSTNTNGGLGGLGDLGSPSYGINNSANSLAHKYPHTRACLHTLLREEGDEVAESVLAQVVRLLGDENEDELKQLLKNTMDDLSEEAAEQAILDLMHSHRDDLNQAPLTVLQATKRPLSRPSSRASTHSFRLVRPESPFPQSSAPSSPKAAVFRRPHTPVTSPLASTLQTNQGNAGSLMTVPNPVSPASSPPLQHATVVNLSAASPTSSPLSSPRFLNAKEFKPGRPLSIGSNPGTPGLSTVDPSNMWAHTPPANDKPISIGSGLVRTSSNLGIAPPLVLTPRSATPINGNPATSRPGSSLAIRPSKPPFDDDSDDEFSPFSKPKTILYKPRQSAPTGIASSEGGTSENSTSPPSKTYDHQTRTSFEDESYDYPYSDLHGPMSGLNIDDGEMPGDPYAPEGMTPLDVLVSVFGATMSPNELENILAQHGWNFEDTMQYLVERGANGQGHTSGDVNTKFSHRSGFDRDRDRNGMHDDRERWLPSRNNRGMPGQYGSQSRQGQMNRPGRVCRYFLAGECLRADCRFSHDLDRALCRFWLRGVCAKGENCEFMHRLPPNMEGPSGGPPFVVNPNINNANGHGFSSRQDDFGPSGSEDFPALGSTPDDRDGPLHHGTRPGFYRTNSGSIQNDPSRTRFAAAVKKPIPSPNAAAPLIVTGGKYAVSNNPEWEGASFSPEDRLSMSSSASNPVPNPRPSPRIRLRSPTLLPTLPTGEVLSKLYMTYRERPIQLQSARNACLARAADAWRRNDGAGAKRFSRDANELNIKMANEAREAASRLLRERVKVLMNEVFRGGSGGGGDAGKAVGNGLGVCLGVRPVEKGSGSTAETEDTRTEVAIDLHGLHANEGVDYLEEFVLALEREKFLGLTYVIVGEEKHTGTQDPARGASKYRLATAVKDWLHRWAYPWTESNGIICLDCLTHV